MIAAQNLNPKVDAYCAKVQPFAQPILAHLRALVHKACPEVEETIKWSRPFFQYRGAILCNMSAFKEHCSFGFWGEEIGAVLRERSDEPRAQPFYRALDAVGVAALPRNGAVEIEVTVALSS